MNSPALSRGIRKGLRTIAQVAAGGALTALVTAMAGGLDPSIQAVVMGAWVALVAFCQNWAETAGKIPTFLPSPGLVVGGAADVVVATVDTITDATGGIVGDVTDTAGDIIGSVTGQTTDDDHEAGGIVVGILIFIAAVVLIFVAFDACVDDEDEVDDLGQGVELVAGGDRGDDNRGGRNKNGRDCEGSEDCSSFSPSFEDSPVILCLPGSTCHF